MALSIDEVAGSTSAVAAIAEENSASVGEVSATAEELSAQAEEVAASAAELTRLAQALHYAAAQFNIGAAEAEQPQHPIRPAAIPAPTVKPQRAPVLARG